MEKTWRCERGSSLIEVIFAILVISVISLSFIKYFYQAEQTSAVSDRKLIAANLARQVAEQYKTRPFSDLLNLADPDRSTPGAPPPAPYYDDSLPDNTVNGVTYHTFVEVQSLREDARLGAYADRLLRLRVTVFWDLSDKNDFRSRPLDFRKRISSTVETFMTREDLRR